MEKNKTKQKKTEKNLKRHELNQQIQMLVCVCGQSLFTFFFCYYGNNQKKICSKCERSDNNNKSIRNKIFNFLFSNGYGYF